MMQFYFIRHAQSANNLLYDSTGSSKGRSHDPALSDTGVYQAVLLAQFLRQGNPDGGSFLAGDEPSGFQLTHLYSSLMVRAVSTGVQAARALGLPLVAWYDLHEEGG
ncbi:MAG TPA: histidine phosphatase family protein, partial [Anaerolineales bacterium]